MDSACVSRKLSIWQSKMRGWSWWAVTPAELVAVRGDESFQEIIPTDVYDKQNPVFVCVGREPHTAHKFVPTPHRYNVQRGKQGDTTCSQAIVAMIRDIQTANLLQERIHSSTWPQLQCHLSCDQSCCTVTKTSDNWWPHGLTIRILPKTWN
jgi:hypothetical protein